MAPKQRTKGKHEIYKDNQSALEFYWRISCVATAVHLVSLLAFFSWLRILATAFMLGMHYLAHRMMRSIARPTFAGGQLMDGGIDLSLPNGLGELMKDLVIFAGIIQIGSVLSDYAWYLLILAPFRAAYLVWPLLSPLLSSLAPSPSPSPAGGMEEKPQRRQSRKPHK